MDIFNRDFIDLTGAFRKAGPGSARQPIPEGVGISYDDECKKIEIPAADGTKIVVILPRDTPVHIEKRKADKKPYADIDELKRAIDSAINGVFKKVEIGNVAPTPRKPESPTEPAPGRRV